MRDDFYREVSQMLRQLRMEGGHSQAAIAKLLGVSRSAYTYYETGKIMPSLQSIRTLAEFHQVPLEVLVYPERYLKTPANGKDQKKPVRQHIQTSRAALRA